MKTDTQLLADLCHAHGDRWSWWRVRRSAKNGNKGGYDIQTDKGIVFVTVSELPEFVRENMKEETP